MDEVLGSVQMESPGTGFLKGQITWGSVSFPLNTLFFPRLPFILEIDPMTPLIRECYCVKIQYIHSQK